MKKSSYFLIALALAIGALLAGQQLAAHAQDPVPDPNLIALGRALFFDKDLSANGTQACAACHAPEVGFTGPDSAVNAAGAVYQGALPNHFGNRKPPSAAYAGDSPVLHQTDDGWFGGMFWDGRATGERLGDPLAEQAQGPFLNPLEQALANAQVLCVNVKKASYAGLFEQVWGAGSLNCAKDTDGVYEKIGRSIAAYERSDEVNPFSSKFDAFWANAKAATKDVTKIKCGSGMGGGGMGGGGMMMGCPAGGSDPYRWSQYRNLGLTDQELQGLAIFNDPNRANCASCHSLTNQDAKGRPLFTDYGYDNIGTPKNPDNPFYSMAPAWNPDGANWIDNGLGAFLKDEGENGKHKVPTLRNVAKAPATDFVKAYGHNGAFKSLEEIVFFYHWRAAMDNCMMNGGNCGDMGGGGMGGGGMGDQMGCSYMDPSKPMDQQFPAPEVDENRATLNMFPCMQVDNIVAFLKTLSDGYQQ